MRHHVNRSAAVKIVLSSQECQRQRPEPNQSTVSKASNHKIQIDAKPSRIVVTWPVFFADVGAALPPHPAAPVLYTCRAGFFPVPLITGATPTELAQGTLRFAATQRFSTLSAHDIQSRHTTFSPPLQNLHQQTIQPIQHGIIVRSLRFRFQ